MGYLSVGFIGLSHLHPKSYMPVFRAARELEVVAVAESNPAVLESFTRDFPVRAYRDWRMMLEQEQLDLAVLFLPHCQCPEAAVACAEQGVHVLAEKPMASGTEGLRHMIAATAKAGVLLSSPYVWRYHPVARAMKRYLEEGALGRVVGCEGRCAAGRLHRYIEGNARWMLSRAMSGGGPMNNLGVHWIDLYRWLLDDEVVEVLGKNVKINEEYDIEDNSFALVTFSRGTVLSLDISYTVPDAFPYGRDLYLALRGTAGVLSWSPSFEGLKEELFVCSDAAGFAPATRRHIAFELDPQAGYAGPCTLPFLKDLAESIRAGKPAAISGEDGLRALEVVEAIYESAETGRAVRPGSPILAGAD
ncbi:MAG TPA: Gfo/Idh/MocA family oxidoreductase [Bryobacteraceae bacterium]|nr:Gfo/Idh/MocA family oxidoreductase [Bryobacteraceae bacterium]